MLKSPQGFFAEEESSNNASKNPLQLFQRKHEVFAKIELDKAFREFELLEGKVLLPKFSHRVLHLSTSLHFLNTVGYRRGVFDQRSFNKCLHKTGTQFDQQLLLRFRTRFDSCLDTS